jgi:hypothetical protein
MPGTGSATPDPAIWIRETLIGANEEYYFSYILERHYPGTYFAFTDVLHLCTFSLCDGSLVADTTLCRTAHVDTTTLGDWTRKDEVHVFPDIGHYLAQRRVELAFPMRFYQKESLVVTPDGIYFESGDKRSQLLAREALGGVFVSDTDEIRLVGQLSVGAYCFLIIESGHWNLDCDSSHRVLPVSKSLIDAARKQLWGTK